MGYFATYFGKLDQQSQLLRLPRPERKVVISKSVLLNLTEGELPRDSPEMFGLERKLAITLALRRKDPRTRAATV